MARKIQLNKNELIEKIMKKKEFSELPRNDVLRIFSEFDSEEFSQEEKLKKTREKLMKTYTVFSSQKVMNLKEKDSDWYLKKHISTKERFDFYSEIYSRIFKNFFNSSKLTIYDLGAGINGLSYGYLPQRFNYIGIEAVGQLVTLMNDYFEVGGIKGKAIQESLFELEEIEKILKKGSGKKVVFLFKTLDSLEMVKRDFSKIFLKRIVPYVDLVVVSWATKTLRKGSKIFATKKWLLEFIENNFELNDFFEIGNEKYISFKKR